MGLAHLQRPRVVGALVSTTSTAGPATPVTRQVVVLSHPLLSRLSLVLQRVAHSGAPWSAEVTVRATTIFNSPGVWQRVAVSLVTRLQDFLRLPLDLEWALPLHLLLLPCPLVCHL
ncbi:uncharacterized protein LOC103506292 [Diaphorina citri]|uniref:Uncharacterized protein LOC103506292 n=1 Tax=Diaphorina citri TaxID=121845 RepID=A0A1S3CVW2_DIACI|nr:uncharacterized protein LOC103506292 [Diaphorina citri]